MKEIEQVLKFKDNFPKEGVKFVDVMPIFRHQKLVDYLCRSVRFRYENKIDVVVGLESRGFLFAEILAWSLNVPFIPIRKKGKLPFPVCEVDSTKEYGTEVLEIGEGIQELNRVLIHDDLLATGGTLRAAMKLVEECDGIVEAVNVLVDINLPEAEEIRKMSNFLAFHTIND